MKCNDFGVYIFDYPEEKDVVLRFFWSAIKSYSLMERIEIIIRILLKKEPKWIYEIDGVKEKA